MASGRANGQAGTSVSPRASTSQATPPASSDTNRDARAGLLAMAVFAASFVVYSLNGDFLPVNDATFSTYLPAILLTRGSVAVTPAEVPSFFAWAVRTPQGGMQVEVNRWDEKIGDSTAAELRQRGELVFGGPKYYATQSVRKDAATGEFRYVNTFGPGAGLVALPLYIVLRPGGNDVVAGRRELWFAGKIVAAALVAGSAAFVFLAARLLTDRRRALSVAAAYALGTCVWSISSQTLWQHGPNEFFLALGSYFLLRARGHWPSAFWCGLSFGLAVACRPTSALIVIPVGAYLWAVDWRRLVAFCLGGLPIALALGAYNSYFFDSPLSFGRAGPDSVDSKFAQIKTGTGDVWQTPLWDGMTGLLFSPSRGLLVFSPVLVFAFVGAYLAWRDARYTALRPLTVGACAMFVVAAKWFDWWGGWTFGYRPVVDTVPLLALLLVPALDRLVRKPLVVGVFGFLLAWSVGVQVLGAFAYDLVGWNARVIGYTVVSPGSARPAWAADRADANRLAAATPGSQVLDDVPADIDRRECRQRLWSLEDNQIVYYLRTFSAARDNKHRLMDAMTE